jgi:magnesium transporter
VPDTLTPVAAGPVQPAIQPPEPDAGTLWIDLTHPGEEQREVVERLTGLHVPTLAELSEIESSSRLSARDGAICISLPMVMPRPDGSSQGAPFGLVVSEDRLLTVRYGDLYDIAQVIENARAAEAAGARSTDLLLTVLEGMVDHLADVLERIGTDIDHLSHRVFHAPPPAERVKFRRTRNTELRASLRSVGRVNEVLMRVREALLSFGRVPPFLNAAVPWLQGEAKPRLKVLRADVLSLTDHIGHLSGQVQFLQDAILGFINIDQNNIIKVLTVVSVVGVPPTLVASIYGMNFKVIPELGWTLGYYYALGLIALTALLPLVWFRRRGWL